MAKNATVKISLLKAKSDKKFFLGSRNKEVIVLTLHNCSSVIRS